MTSKSEIKDKLALLQNHGYLPDKHIDNMTQEEMLSEYNSQMKRIKFDFQRERLIVLVISIESYKTEIYRSVEIPQLQDIKKLSIKEMLLRICSSLKHLKDHIRNKIPDIDNLLGKMMSWENEDDQTILNNFETYCPRLRL